MADSRTVIAKTVTLTESDSTNITGVSGLFVGTAGDVHVRVTETAATVIYKNVANGTQLYTGPIDRLLAATTAADILGNYVG